MSTEHISTLAADIIDTRKLNERAHPRNSFYGKAYAHRTVDDNSVTYYHLISYGMSAARAYFTHKVGACEFELQMFNIDELATATTRRHIRAFAELIADYAQSGLVDGMTCYIHVSASTKRTAGQILPLRNRPRSFSIIYDENSGSLAEAVRGLVTRILKQYPMPQTIRKYERADECKRLFWNYSEYAYSVRTYDKDDSAGALISEAAYSRL